MGGGFLESEPSHTTYTEVFEKNFPFYLAIGMSYAEYWTGDPFLVRYYRKAFNMKQEQEDYNAWLQGMYFYEAVSTALGNSFRKKGTPPLRYSEVPYLQRKKEEKKQQEDTDKPDKFEIWMNNIVANGANSVQQSG